MLKMVLSKFCIRPAKSLKGLLNSTYKYLSISRTMSTKLESTDMATFEIINNKGIITLRRPQRLNAYNLALLKSVFYKLIEWENRVDMVIVQGEGRAFCAGGDVVSLTEPGPERQQSTKEFFRNEYSMNGLIGHYGTPYVALIDGITMGGGVGLSVHSKVRIATERTLFAMPETIIGFFPDVGVSHVLSRMPNQLGQYFGLTGDRLKGTDVVKVGIATHYTRSENIPKILKGLIELDHPETNLNEFLLENTEDISNVEFSLQPYLQTIEKTFSAPTVEEIIKRLQEDKSEFAIKTEELLKKMSPFCLKITKKHIDIAKKQSLIECVTIDNRLAGAMIEARISPDMFEGVRALLIDKDQNPQWKPATLEEVTDEMVEKAFEKLSPEEELNFAERINKLRSKIQSKL